MEEVRREHRTFNIEHECGSKPNPNGWKHKFKEGEPLALKGTDFTDFILIKINNRGLTLHRANPPALAPEPVQTPEQT